MTFVSIPDIKKVTIITEKRKKNGNNNGVTSNALFPNPAFNIDSYLHIV